MSRQSLLAIRRGRRAVRTSTFDSNHPAFDPYAISKSNPNPSNLVLCISDRVGPRLLHSCDDGQSSITGLTICCSNLLCVWLHLHPLLKLPLPTKTPHLQLPRKSMTL